MIESRCGLRCGACSYRETQGCPGCTELINGPFWGECRLKNCCEQKHLAHCGQCGEFLHCEMLRAFSYDKEQGDGGRRIAQCKAWQAAAPRYQTTLLAVEDMPRAKRFYTRLLGLAVLEDIGANVTLTGGVTLQQREVWQQLLGGAPVTLGHNAAELYFEVQDIDAFAAEAETFGAEMFQPMHETPWGQRLLRLRDPDGNLVEVGEDMHAVTRRFLASGMTKAEAAARMGVPLAYVEHYGAPQP